MRVTEELLKKSILRKEFEKEMKISWVNKQGEPDFDYVEWLENKIIITENYLKEYRKQEIKK